MELAGWSRHETKASHDSTHQGKASKPALVEGDTEFDTKLTYTKSEMYRYASFSGCLYIRDYVRCSVLKVVVQNTRLQESTYNWPH